MTGTKPGTTGAVACVRRRAALTARHDATDTLVLKGMRTGMSAGGVNQPMQAGGRATREQNDRPPLSQTQTRGHGRGRVNVGRGIGLEGGQLVRAPALRRRRRTQLAHADF